MAAAAEGGGVFIYSAIYLRPPVMGAPACIAMSEQLLAARIYLLICARHLFACAFIYLRPPKLSLQPEPFG